MRKLFYLFTATVLAGSLLTGCEDEENEGPGIRDLKVNGVLVSESSYELVGEVTISFTVEDDNEVSSWNIKEEGSSNIITNGSGEPKKAKADVSLKYNFTTGKKLIITVVDDDDKMASKSLGLLVDNGVTNYSARLLGSYDNATEGSFLASASGTVYLMAAAKTNASAVDVVYYYGQNNLATLSAPSDTASLNKVFGKTGNAPATWSERKATIFKKTTLTPTDFNNTVKQSSIQAIYNSISASDVKANNLSVGNVVVFKSGDSYGYLHVSALVAGAAGSMTVDVKVPKVLK